MKKIIFILMAVFFTVTNVLAQGTIKGKVQDKDGNPLAGATIKSNSATVTSDANGNFTVAAERGEKLSVSYIGFASATVKAVNGVEIILSADVKSDTEVIVTGYKTLSKRNFSGSAGVVKGDDIRLTPIASFDQALQGQTAGVMVRATSGQPGNSGSLVIRGKGSLNLSTEPTYIVDGIQISAADFAAINPNDIENVSVLKDGVAASQYGSRGGNGVVLVTTRKGKAGKPKLEIEAYTAWSTFPDFRDFKLMNTSEKIDYELRRGGTSLGGYTTGELDSMRKINSDWQDILTRRGRTNSVNATASGGTEKTRYYASVNYFKQEGTLVNTGYDRITGRINVNQDAGNFSFGLNTLGTYSNYQNTAEQNTSIASPLNAIQWANPYEQEFVNGSYNAAANFVAGGSSLTRPRVTETGQPMPTTELYWNTNSSKSIRFVGGVNAEYKIPFIKGLSVKSVYGIDYRQYDDFRFVDRRSYSAGSNPRPLSGSSSNFRTNSFATDFSNSQRITNTNSLNYSTKFGDHTIDVGAYYEYIQAKSKNNGRTLFGLQSNFQNDAGSTVNADLLPRVRFGGVERKLESWFGLLNYGFKNKYFLTANLRRDGASVFGPNNKYATFYGVGASWAMLEEKFMSKIAGKVLSELKFKVSYGTVGNGADQLGSYAWQGTVSNRLYNAVNGTIAATLENPDLQWETREKFNTGFEFGFLNNRITGSVEFYNETTKDMILDAQISRTTGFSSIRKNIGSVRNRGLEFNSNAVVYERNGLKINVSGNITFNNNKILELAGRDSIISGVFGNNVLAIGKPLNSLFMVEYAGVDPSNGDALYRKLDGSTTNVYSVNDRKIIGNSEPNIFGGFGFGVEYKGFNLSSQFAYMLNSLVYNNERNNIENPDYYYDNMNADLLNEWQRPGQVTNIPSPDTRTVAGVTYNVYQSATTRFVEDNSFLRLRNVTLGYTLPSSIMKKIKMKGIMVYVSGTNLWTSTKYRGRDPEFPNTDMQGAQYPALKTIQTGVRFNF